MIKKYDHSMVSKYILYDSKIEIILYTVESVYNGHPRDWTKLTVISADCLSPKGINVVN